MELNEIEIANIIHNNISDNLICRVLESRPGELAKYICGLANKDGGYVLIGVEKAGGILKLVGFQRAFNMNTVMDTAYKKMAGALSSAFGYISVLGRDIFAIQVEKSKQAMLADNNYYCYKNNGVEVQDTNVLIMPSTLFISYTECDTPIVDIIEKKLGEKLQDKIQISRYTGLRYKDSFKAFMDTIQDHDFVLTVVSDTYLKRQACMYEVGETTKAHHYKNKLLFVVLSENERKYYGDNAPIKIGADIYGNAVMKLEYTRFWQMQYDSLKETMNQIGDFEATKDSSRQLQIIGQIYRKDLGEFLQFLSDENGMNFQQLYENEFDDIVEWIVDNK